VPSSSLAPGETVRIRDERWIVTRHTPGVSASVLDVRGRDRSNLDARASFLLPFEVVERLASDRSPRRVRPRRWRRVARALLAEATPSWQSLRTPLRARISLLPFQLEPALAATHGMAARLLIADEVGLGKTIQAALIIAEILERTRHGRALIVAPASLKEQWEAELRNRFGLDAWLADSASLARLSAAWGTSNPWAGRPVTITSIDFVKRPEVMRSLEALIWDAVVFDEAHGLSGFSDRARAAGALARRARTVVLLSATPHSGDDAQYESLCRIGDLNAGFPLLTFRRTRHDVGLALSRRTTTLNVRPSLAEQEMHRALLAYTRKVRRERGAAAHGAHLAMTVLTRRACSSASSLARSVARRLDFLAPAEPSPISQMRLPLFEATSDDEPWSELSVPGLDNREEERRHLDRLLMLARRAASAESKVNALTRFLRRSHEPAVVFTEYRDTLVHLASELVDLGPATLHGGLAPAERRESLRRFTIGDCPLLLATDAASEGLNLQQRCRLVINLEQPWTPLRLEQRIGRVERIGQSRRVHVVHLLASGTSEEIYVASLHRRTDRVANALAELHQTTTTIRLPAIIEANRLAQLRRLAASCHMPVVEGRPPVVAVRRRKERGCLWGFRFEFIDLAHEVVWHTLIGARTSRLALSTLGSRSIDRAATSIASKLEGDLHEAQVALAQSLHQYRDLASRRERAIAETIEGNRARLSATLLQPGLFDRRVERAVAAHSGVLDEALTRCRARLAELAATTHVVSEPGRLAFVLVRR
jgi:superfamily II DNA or RNA helicase